MVKVAMTMEPYMVGGWSKDSAVQLLKVIKQRPGEESHNVSATSTIIFGRHYVRSAGIYHIHKLHEKWFEV